MWIFYAVLYAVGIGVYQVIKKQMVKKAPTLVCLSLFTLSCLALVLYQIPEALTIDWSMLWILAMKGCVISAAWYCTITAMKSLDVSKVTPIRSLSTIIVVLVGIFAFNEEFAWFNIVGASLAVLGIILTGYSKSKEKRKTEMKPILFAFISAILNAVSSLIDKYTLQTITPAQMQFWYMLFLTIIPWVALVIVSIKNRKWIIEKAHFKNYFIYIAAVLLVVSDFFLFHALAIPGSMISVVSIIGKFSVVVSFFAAIAILKERPHYSKYLFLVLIIVGIILTTI